MKMQKWLVVFLVALSLFGGGCKKKKKHDDQAKNPNEIPISAPSTTPAGTGQ